MNGSATRRLPDQLAVLQKRLVALSEENDLLLTQLNRMLDESGALGHTPPASHADVDASDHGLMRSLLRWWAQHQPDSLEVDLREFICGDNWHHAESDGRWAGPATRSVIRLPALGAGHYAFRLEIVDAMDPPLLTQAQVLVDGRPTPVQLQFDGSFPATLSFRVSVEETAAESTDIELVFPYVLSPRDRGVPDDRLLTVRARSLQVRRES